jgi:carbon monoxide dehydrogenase subunit G
MLTGRAEGTIRRPIEDVYEFMADFRNNPQWCPMELEVRRLDGDGRVARFENKVKPGPKVLTNLYEVTRESPNRITFTGSNEMADFDGYYELTENGDGTHVVAVSNLAMHGRAMRLLSTVMRPMIGSNAKKQLRLLTELLEGDA